MLGSSPAHPQPLKSSPGMVSPLTRSLVSPSSKLTSAAISIVHKLLRLPNSSLGLRWSISRKASAPSGLKAR